MRNGFDLRAPVTYPPRYSAVLPGGDGAVAWSMGRLPKNL